MKITNVDIHKFVSPNKGHIGFASCIIDGWLFLGNIAVMTRLVSPEKIRLVFPQKKIGREKVVNIFYPVDAKYYYILENAISEALKTK